MITRWTAIWDDGGCRSLGSFGWWDFHQSSSFGCQQARINNLIYISPILPVPIIIVMPEFLERQIKQYLHNDLVKYLMRWCGCQPCVPLDIKYDAARDRVQLPACQVHSFTRPSSRAWFCWSGAFATSSTNATRIFAQLLKVMSSLSKLFLTVQLPAVTFTNIFKKQRIQRGLQLLYECQSLHCILPCNAGYKPVPSQVYPSQFLFFPQFGNTLHIHAGPSDLASLS